MELLKTTKAIAVACAAYVAAKLGVLAPWLSVLVLAMALDYISGIAAAGYTQTLSSRVGLRGIVKKIAYLLLVAVAIITDWVLASGGGLIGFTGYTQGAVALTIILWLVVNELLSILENLGRLDVPLPRFLLGLLASLKDKADKSPLDTEAKK